MRLITTLAALMAIQLCSQSAATAQIYLPNNGHHFVGLTPDNRTLVTDCNAWTSFQDVETGRLVVIDREQPQAFPACGLSDDGRWLIGGGVAGESMRIGEALPPTTPPRSLYYCPLADCLGNSYQDSVRQIDLSEHLPVDEFPRLLPVFEHLEDLGNERFAVVMQLYRNNGRRPPKQALRHCIVFSTRTGSVELSRAVAGEKRRSEAEAATLESLSMIEVLRKTPKQTQARRRTIPLDLGYDVSTQPIARVPGPCFLAADDGESILASDARGLYIGSMRDGSLVRLIGWRDPVLPLDAVFSRDATRIAIGSFRNAKDRAGGMKLIMVFDTKTGERLQSIPCEPDGEHRVNWGLAAFSSDQSYLLAHHTRYDGPGGDVIEGGYTLFDLEVVK